MKDSVRIEVYFVTSSDRHPNVEPPSGFDQIDEIIESLDVAVWVKRVAIPAESEMFERMETRNRVCAADSIDSVGHQIMPDESNIRMFALTKRAYVEHLDGPEACDMCNKSVYSRSNVDMSSRIVAPDTRRNKEVLVKVVPPRAACGFLVVGACDRHTVDFSPDCDESIKVPNKPWQVPERGKLAKIQSEPADHARHIPKTANHRARPWNRPIQFIEYSHLPRPTLS